MVVRIVNREDPDQAEGRRFELHRSHCAVSLSKTESLPSTGSSQEDRFLFK